MSEKSQFALLSQKRFLPFFITQFFGAFNDNVYKNALVVLISFSLSKAESDVLINVAFGLFILPFFLFSAIAGQVANKVETSNLVRKIKLVEISIMLLAFIGIYFHNIPFLIFVLFLMGMQSSLFGPVKYSYLPRVLNNHELIGGNALFEMSTFLAILLGTILGGVVDIEVVSYVVIVVAVIGYFSSRSVPEIKAVRPDVKINWNIYTSTVSLLKFLPSNKVVFLSVLGISWFWFFGSVILAQIPNFSNNVLQGDKYVYTLLISMFSIGIGVGSMLCEKLSGRRVEIGLVPLGAIGLAIFGFDLSVAGGNWQSSTAITVHEFYSSWPGVRICLDLAMIGLFGGLYIVPLYALVQERSKKADVSRVIAGNNVINALFMVVAALMSMLVLKTFDMDIPQLFMITMVLHVLVSIYIFTVVPEFIVRLFAWLLVSLIYRVKYQGLDNIPAEGPAVLVCNHVSFLDPLILGGRIRRPVRFVMYYKIYDTPVMKYIFKAAKAIPIAGHSENETLKEQAFKEIREALALGHLVCIFPEGGLSSDGKVASFKSGIDRILAESSVPVIPMALHNLWGSLFSRYDKKMIDRRPRKFMAKVDLVVGELIANKQADGKMLFEQVKLLKQSVEKENTCLND